ncbi:MAG: Uncharacterised protein [Prochlorococcus marinus str. MIT 9215]|nr:MAG: Uncharacterised protein [Prochlorococcus marinus str. MIT 9215]
MDTTNMVRKNAAIEGSARSISNTAVNIDGSQAIIYAKWKGLQNQYELDLLMKA